MIAKCPKCGFKIELDDMSDGTQPLSCKCPRCGSQMVADIPQNNQKQMSQSATDSNDSPSLNIYDSPEAPQQSPIQSQVSNAQPISQPQPSVYESQAYTTIEESHAHTSKAIPVILITIGTLAVVAVAVFVFYLPYLKDKNAPREYSIANATNLRSSKDAGGDYNKIRSLPFGSELKTYSNDGEWTEVKDADGEKGFMSSDMLVSKPDFLILNSIYGDMESRDVIATIKCRKALLNYYKTHHYYGKLSQENLKLISPNASVNSSNQWQVFCKAKDVKPNSVFFPRLINTDSKYTDFAVIIKNISTNERKILFFNFDDNGTPHFVAEQKAPESGYIVDMWKDEYDNFQIQYSE